MEACPVEAIFEDEKGVVLVDREKCDGCGNCVEACPYGMIEQDEEDLAYKCDYCGGAPACVKECSPGALVYQGMEKEVNKLRLLQMKQRMESDTDNPEEKRHQLGLKLLKMA